MNHLAVLHAKYPSGLHLSRTHSSLLLLAIFAQCACTDQTISRRSAADACSHSESECEESATSSTDDNSASNSATSSPTPVASPTSAVNFSGLPSGTFTKSTFELSFSSSNVENIKYKVGTDPLDCSDSTGYSAPLATSTPVTIDTASLADGTIKLCFVSQFSGGSWQSYADASVETWIQNLSPVVEARWNAAPNWNDYVSPSNSHAACNAATDTDCIHGGEYRKVVTSISSCTGLELSDDLDLFDWTCQVESGVAVFTGKLKFDVGLAELITHGSPTGSWNSNFVTLTGASYGNRSSSAAAWWTNPVVEVPNHVGTSVTLGASYAGKIVTDNSVSLTDGININADKIGMFFASASRITGTFNGNCNTTTGEPNSFNSCPIATGGQNFLWVEGFKALAGGGASVGILAVNTKYSRFRDIRSQLYGDGVKLENVKYSRFEKIHVAESNGFRANNSDYNEFYDLSTGGYSLNGYGIYLNNSSYNRFSKLRFFGAGLNSFGIAGDSNIVTNYYAAFSANAATLGAYGESNIFAAITGTNIRYGVIITENSNLLHNALLANITNYGI